MSTADPAPAADGGMTEPDFTNWRRLANGEYPYGDGPFDSNHIEVFAHDARKILDAWDTQSRELAAAQADRDHFKALLGDVGLREQAARAEAEVLRAQRDAALALAADLCREAEQTERRSRIGARDVVRRTAAARLREALGVTDQ